MIPQNFSDRRTQTLRLLKCLRLEPSVLLFGERNEMKIPLSLLMVKLDSYEARKKSTKICVALTLQNVIPGTDYVPGADVEMTMITGLWIIFAFLCEKSEREEIFKTRQSRSHESNENGLAHASLVNAYTMMFIMICTQISLKILICFKPMKATVSSMARARKTNQDSFAVVTVVQS